MTTPILFREYIWLVNTIYRAKKISLSEINDKWTGNRLPLPCCVKMVMAEMVLPLSIMKMRKWGVNY